ncbi:hypothetical protein OF83DRAFT_466371 [Amylostereum chailletii]|nr:hypothetical protein OF83DRAFT_466371 [Amylostereum chailletii]
MPYTNDMDSASEASLLSSGSSASYLSSPALPSTNPRRKPTPIRLQPIGVDPADIVGKVITRIRPSLTHPAVTLDFDDNSTYQVRVDGYDPVYRGIPKALEMNTLLRPLFQPTHGMSQVHLTVADCRLVSLKDVAHQRNDGGESRWSVEHLALAFKFEEQPGWHCCWAIMTEYDGENGPCTFRSFDDVYLDQMPRSPRKHRRKQSHT